LGFCRIVVPDLPGCGHSAALAGPHTIAAYTAWLDEFLASLDLVDVVICGHSYGGIIALSHAATGVLQPTASIAISPAVAVPRIMQTLPALYYRAARYLPEEWRQRMVANVSVDRLVGWLMLRGRARNRRMELASRRRRTLSQLRPDVVIEQYESILRCDLQKISGYCKAAVLIIGGSKDRIAPLNRLRALTLRIPGAQLKVLPDVGHMAPIEEPDKTAELIERFLVELRRADADTAPEDGGHVR
jgi:pimeloyl-ACP methyl ester carboxylesterase